jgi:hypothetical protein
MDTLNHLDPLGVVQDHFGGQKRMIRGRKTDDLTHFGPPEVVPEVENGRFEAKNGQFEAENRRFEAENGRFLSQRSSWTTLEVENGRF